MDTLTQVMLRAGSCMMDRGWFLLENLDEETHGVGRDTYATTDTRKYAKNTKKRLLNLPRSTRRLGTVKTPKREPETRERDGVTCPRVEEGEEHQGK